MGHKADRRIIHLISSGILGLLTNALLHTRVAAFTTSNMGELLLSWQGIVLILVGLAVILVLVTLELFSMIILFDDVLKGRQQNVFRQAFSVIKRAFAVLPRFFRPAGLLILLYLVIALPLIGVRFLMSFNRLIRIPNFIMEPISSLFQNIAEKWL